jgi:Secretion system C-terminal sorting domain
VDKIKKPNLCGATKFDKDGNIKWHRSYVHNTKDGLSQRLLGGEVTKDKGFILCGSAFDTLPAPKGGQGWLLKLDSLGCLVPGCATSTSTEEQEMESFFSIFPNPSSENITVQIQKENQGNRKVELIDSYGRVVYKYNILSNESTINIDVSNYAAGTYFLSVKSERLRGVKKVVVLK